MKTVILFQDPRGIYHAMTNGEPLDVVVLTGDERTYNDDDEPTAPNHWRAFSTVAATDADYVNDLSTTVAE